MSKTTTGKTEDNGKKSAESEEGGMNWLFLAGVGLVCILAASVYLQPEGKATVETTTETTTQLRPKKDKKIDVLSQPARNMNPGDSFGNAFVAAFNEEQQKLKKKQEEKEAAQKQEKKKKKPRVQQFAMHIPRLTLAELHKNATLRTGHHAFIITDIANKSWKAMSWTLDSLKEKIPFEWVDYYPENMMDQGKHPYLFKLEQAVPQFKQPNGHSKYMQMRISLRGWKRIRKDLSPLPDHPTFWDDSIWIRDCMQKDGKPDEKAIDNFYTTNQWKFLLIGQKGTSMFFHKDHTAASSWQAQIMGRKSWTFCPNSESPYLDIHLNTYKPDYKKFPLFAKALCGQVTVQPGEMVYYPGYMWHHTLQHDTPSISYTGALVGTEAERDDLGQGNGKVHRAFYRDLQQKCRKCWAPGVKERQCDDISLKWPGAAPPMMRKVCEVYLPKCLALWDAHSDSLWHRPTLEKSS